MLVINIKQNAYRLPDTVDKILKAMGCAELDDFSATGVGVGRHSEDEVYICIGETDDDDYAIDITLI